MDAQRFDGQFYSAYTPYANYAFGNLHGRRRIEPLAGAEWREYCGWVCAVQRKQVRVVRSTRTCRSPM